MPSSPLSLPPSSPPLLDHLSSFKGLPPSSPLSTPPSSPRFSRGGNPENPCPPLLPCSQTPEPLSGSEPDPSDSDPGVERSEDVVGTPQTRRKIMIDKSQKKRAATNTAKRNAREREALYIAEDAERRKKEYFQKILANMNEDGYSFGDMVMYFLDPNSWQGSVRWHQFLAHPGRLERMLDWFSSSEYPPSVRKGVQKWAVAMVCELLKDQAAQVTQSGLLKTYNREIDEAFLCSFDLKDLYGQLKEGGGDLIIQVFEAVAHSKNHPTFSKQRHLQGKVIVTSSILSCLKEHNHYNNLSQVVMSMYLYGNGAQRQTITILSRVGICESYPSLVRNEAAQSQIPTESGRVVAIRRAPRVVPSKSVVDGRRLGILPLLSVSMRKKARNLAQTGLIEEIFDNINFQSKVGEQNVGSHNTQENGTCPTIIELWEAALENLQTSKLLDAFLNASLLRKEDILHNNEESLLFRHCLVHDIVQIVIDFSGQASLKAFAGVAKEKQPLSHHRIKVHKTKIYPLPTLNIDESTIKGNAEVDEAVVKELGLDSVEEFWSRVRLVAGDQLSLARLRSLLNIRAGQEGEYEGFSWLVMVPGLFHVKMADVHGIMITYFGQMNNPSCITRDNTALNRLPLTLTSLPNYRTCLDIILVSLYARILTCLLIVSNQPTLEAYGKSVKSFRQLQDDAAKVYDRFVSTGHIHELRSERELLGKGHGDVVFENAVLFNRDALYSYELGRAVKAGDSGRVVLVLKIWALSFRGSGRTKYAHEMLHLIHSLTHVWPKEVVEIVLNNWLVNTTGKENRFLEADLLQEHLNYWIKVFYKAHGSNLSWEWLAMIAPCVNILRHLAAAMNASLGSRQGSRHSSVDLQNDIAVLMKSYKENRVYEVQNGRTVNDDDTQVFADNVTKGLDALTNGSNSPLTEYNTDFKRLQKRRRMPPVSTNSESSEPRTPNHDPTPVPHSPPIRQEPISPTLPLSPTLETHSNPDHIPSGSTQPTATVAHTDSQISSLDPDDIPMANGARALSDDGENGEAETVVSGLESWQRDPTFVCMTESDVELFSDMGEGDDFSDTDLEDDEM
ncbi:hypothetical protein PQX77_020553 [Marasmius sp. AFHP31]|nr:hypothetical protein PQX77_020553 [Marasmius sp. AFHP31]